jgi:hypothetical protein
MHSELATAKKFAITRCVWQKLKADREVEEADLSGKKERLQVCTDWSLVAGAEGRQP